MPCLVNICCIYNNVNAKHIQIVTANLVVLATPIQLTVTPSLDKGAARNATVKKYVYLTTVATGAYARGQQDCSYAPVDRATHCAYDSVYDDVTKTFVVFSRKQAYPAYLITFQ